MKKPRVLLIGAGGIVGTALYHDLSEKNLELTCISRGKKYGPARFISHDASMPIEKLFSKLKEQYDAIIINAGYTGETQTSQGLLQNYLVNVKYIHDLLMLAGRKKIKKIVYTSTFSFLQKPFDKLIDENHKIASADAYSSAKFLAETAVMKLAKEKKIKAFSFRIPSPINTGNLQLHKNVVRTWTERASAGEDIKVFGKGNRQQNFIDARAIADIYYQAITNNKTDGGIYNLASTKSISMKSLAELIAAKYKVHAKLDPSQKEDVSYRNISIAKLDSEFDTSAISDSKSTIKELLNGLNA